MQTNHKKQRFEILDFIRGISIFLMFAYHFSYDLDYFGYIQQSFTQDLFWTRFRTLIVTLFITVMGASLYLASYKGIAKKSFRKRLILLVIYSALVSISSWIMFPSAMILFGILHFITVASLLGLLFIPLGIINLFLGLAIIISAQIFSHPVFDLASMQWLGFVTKLPIAVDYVPLFPWFGVVLIGMYLGQKLSNTPKNSALRNWKNHHPVSRYLALSGRYSLHIYMLHQPLFLGILYIISQVIS
ncbi:MAG: heparan-alpha-glucosaminide N-acetyltransferase [Woeseiaceae bacterium]